LSNDGKMQPVSVSPDLSQPLPSLAPVPAPSVSSAKQAELRLLINSRNPILTVETTEEQRFSSLLERVAAELNIPLFVWSVTQGLGKVHGTSLYNSEEPDQALANIATIKGDAVFLLCDFVRYCDKDIINRRLRDLADGFRTARRSIVLLAAGVQLPPELQADAVSFQLGLPSPEELLPGVRRVFAELKQFQNVAVMLDAAVTLQVAKNLAGLPEEEALRLLRMTSLSRGKVDQGILPEILEAKRKSLQASGLLETLKSSNSFSEVQGLERLRQWIAKRKSALTPEGQKFGLEPPKGVLITGVQGCGKSLAARAIAGEWGYQLARLDAGALYDKFVGESEKHLKKALELAQRLSPVVLWIDEIEKAFASAGSSGDADAGLSQRLLATLLTWMQDRESGVFLAATSNNITILPPEMLRKGRFDEIFFVDLPTAKIREGLFALHLKKRGRDASAFDLPKLAAATEGFSGAEIEQAIVAGLYTAFSQKQQLSTDILLGEVAATQPLSVTRSEEITAIRAWARARTSPAD
jgi:AAA+ superfamily predicted ATPase